MPPTETSLRRLVRRAHRLVEARSGRVLLGITGPPGAGKTTLADGLAEAFGPGCAVVGMDGFHLAEAELRRLGRHDRKGAIDTFDADGYVALLRRLRDPLERVVYAPAYDRTIDEAVAGSVAVGAEVRLVVTEGNYLLVDTGAWAAVRPLLDEAWYCHLADPERAARLVARHRLFGRTTDEARLLATGNDQRNATLVATTAARADVVVTIA